MLLGNPVLEDLEDRAKIEGRTLSNLCLQILRRSMEHSWSEGQPGQTTLSSYLASTASTGGIGFTFRDSKRKPIHRWYPYVEGFSAAYVHHILTNLGSKVKTIYDPFGGCGTAQLEASLLGVPSFYSEINPFAATVCEAKVNASREAKEHWSDVEKVFQSFLSNLRSDRFKVLTRRVSLGDYKAAFPSRNYFVEKDIRELLAALMLADESSRISQPAGAILRVAVASIAVPSSNMTRRADLRRRRPGEYKNRVVNVREMLRRKVFEVIEDLTNMPKTSAPTRFISADCRSIPPEYLRAFDFALTSPPYLNGTNYFRNSKIELWLLGFIKNEQGLRKFTSQAIRSGINNISGKRNFTRFDVVEKFARAVDKRAYDNRIPALVRGYFSDMHSVLQSVFGSLVEGSHFVLDMGDSRFAGVHIPTDIILSELARDVGFEILANRILAKRYSIDKTELRQVELLLQKPRGADKSSSAVNISGSDPISSRIASFRRSLPYKAEPYCKRNWGHPFHSLCSYQGKLKPAVAHWLVLAFTEPGACILDPLGGVGTIAFEACIQGRYGITNDLSPFASVVARAKVRPPTPDDCARAILELSNALDRMEIQEEDMVSAQFGLNARVADYYHPKTLREILKARRFYLDRDLDDAHAFVKASLLHVLHGNRPYALSRTSHPITPFHPEGESVYRSLIQKVRQRCEILTSSPLPASFMHGEAYAKDFRDLPEQLSSPVDAIITSPPFMGMRFDRPNWLRMWFCGWEEKDFHERSRAFLERQQMESLNVYDDFFLVAKRLLQPHGILILHTGGSYKYDMASALIGRGSSQFTFVDRVAENVQGVEKHGIVDKGTTTTHEFLFFTP